MELEISIDHVAETCVVTLSGEVDAYTAPRLKDTLVELIEGGCVRMVLDMGHVTFIDSSGLGVLVGAVRRLKERSGAMHLVCTRENVLKIFRITGLDKVFPIFPNVRDASEF